MGFQVPDLGGFWTWLISLLRVILFPLPVRSAGWSPFLCPTSSSISSSRMRKELLFEKCTPDCIASLVEEPAAFSCYPLIVAQILAYLSVLLCCSFACTQRFLQMQSVLQASACSFPNVSPACWEGCLPPRSPTSGAISGSPGPGPLPFL